jgi:hypothetical protein
MKPLHLFLELFTLASFLATAVWAMRRWGRDGAWLAGLLFALGAVRENYVVVERYLYGFADLTLELGRAPAIAAVVWGFSILAGVAGAEAILGRAFSPGRMPTAAELGVVALFMIALAGFYEPLLARVEMARWEQGTVTVVGVPTIALVGYPTFAALSLVAIGAILRRWPGTSARLVASALAVPLLAALHASGLQALKRSLGW